MQNAIATVSPWSEVTAQMPESTSCMGLRGHRAELSGLGTWKVILFSLWTLCPWVQPLRKRQHKSFGSTRLATGLQEGTWMAQTQCFAISRNNFIVMATWKEATLTEYVDQLPGNRRSGLTGRQKLSLIQQPCLWPGLNAPSLPGTGSSGGSLCLACLREADLHSLILPILDNHAQSL